MLEPNDRTLLHEILRPPTDYRLDIAIGTTYSLDLISLLSAPVSFALFDLDVAEASVESGGLEILESVRRYADRTTVFAMAGQIAVPSAYRAVLTYCEQSIVQVRRPAEGRVFHPKLWVLRFAHPQTGDQLHRVIVLSRNLTYDAAWDISAVLDEVKDGKGQPCAEPLADFLLSIERLAIQPLAQDRSQQLHDIASTLRSAAFEVPDLFDSMRLHPMGNEFTSPRFPDTCERALVISPFISEDQIRRWRKSTRKLTLISRADELDRLPASVIPDDTYVLSPHTQPMEEESSELSGLHAKVYVADDGNAATWWLGSANATHAAFSGNCEFLLELVGSESSFGVQQILAAREGELGLISLLEPYIRADSAPVDGVLSAISPEDEAIIALAEHGLVVTVGDAVESGPRIIYPVTVSSTASLPLGVSVTVRPLALRGDDEAKPLTEEGASWAGVALTSVSPYVVVRVHGEGTIERVLLAQLRGEPPHRREAVLAQLIQSQEGFLRYLLLLLSEGSFDFGISGGINGLLHESPTFTRRNFSELPLLESLLRSLSRNPADLERVSTLLRDLRRTPEGKDLVPEDFEDIWLPISEALTALHPGHHA